MLVKVIDLKSYADFLNYLSNSKCFILEFYDPSKGQCKLVSTRLQSKINCADINVSFKKVE